MITSLIIAFVITFIICLIIRIRSRDSTGLCDINLSNSFTRKSL